MPAKGEYQKGRMLAKGFLGDWIESGLKAIGITPERVEKWIGRPCGCEERKQKLNALDAAIRRIVTGHTDNMQEHLNTLMDEDKERAEAAKHTDARKKR